jgi:hypothetical protein
MTLRIEDLPFEEREPLSLLGIVRGRHEPDLEFGGYGWATVPDLELAASHGERSVVHHPLVLALHTPDEPDETTTELEVELEVELDAEIVSVLVPLHRLLEVKVTPLVSGVRDVVLALCNPRALRPTAPPWLPGRRLHYATGDVIAWLDVERDGRETIRLQAERWHALPETRTC